MTGNIYIYIAVMALTTYLIRMLPLVLVRREIKSVFLRSFLTYVPYAALSAMTFPAILSSTDSIISAALAFVTAIILSYLEKSLIVVALSSCAVVFISERIIDLLG